MKGRRLKNYLSVRETAEKLNVSRQGVLYLIEQDTLPAEYVDTFYLIPAAAVDKLIQSRQGTTDQRIKAK